jgi:hypothetical protein
VAAGVETVPVLAAVSAAGAASGVVLVGTSAGVVSAGSAGVGAGVDGGAPLEPAGVAVVSVAAGAAAAVELGCVPAAGAGVGVAVAVAVAAGLAATGPVLTLVGADAGSGVVTTCVLAGLAALADVMSEPTAAPPLLLDEDGEDVGTVNATEFVLVVCVCVSRATCAVEEVELQARPAGCCRSSALMTASIREPDPIGPGG